jgi:hypothetical protein
MAKTLELQFVTEGGNNARLSVDNPKEPIEEAVVKQTMEVFSTNLSHQNPLKLKPLYTSGNR